MTERNSTTNSATDRFWDRFIANLQKQGVKGKNLITVGQPVVAAPLTSAVQRFECTYRVRLDWLDL